MTTDPCVHKWKLIKCDRTVTDTCKCEWCGATHQHACDFEDNFS